MFKKKKVDPLPSNVSGWKAKDINNFLARLGMAKYDKTFERMGYDEGDTVLNLTETELKDIGVEELGFRRKLLWLVNKIKTGSNSWSESYMPIEQPKKTGFLASVASNTIPYGDRDASTWSLEDVVDWLKKNDAADYVDIFKKQQIDGVGLTSLSDADLIEIGVDKPGHRKKFVLKIEAIKANGNRIPRTGGNSPLEPASPTASTSASAARPAPAAASFTPEDAVLPKLSLIAKRQNLTDDELRMLCRNLGTPIGIKKNYLNKDFEQIKAMYQSLPPPSNDRPQRSGIMSSVSSGSTVVVDEEDLDDDDFLDMNTIEQQQKSAQHQLKDNKIKVKLIIAEIAHSSTQKNIRKILSPVMNNLSINKQKFGMFHSALVVGPWYLEWTNSSLCIPRKCYSNAALLAVDVEEGRLAKNKLDLDFVIEKVTDVIVEWNCNKNYDRFKYNCQTFVDALCGALGLDLNFQGTMGEYLDKLRKAGECEVSYKVPADIREECGIRESNVKFNTHEELDQFVLNIMEKNCMFQENYKEDWMLLKSFDRAFWLRSYKNEDNPMFQPLKHNGVCVCPFNDPQQTNSFKKEWW